MQFHTHMLFHSYLTTEVHVFLHIPLIEEPAGDFIEEFIEICKSRYAHIPTAFVVDVSKKVSYVYVF